MELGTDKEGIKEGMKKKILLVDDEQLLLRVIGESL